MVFNLILCKASSMIDFWQKYVLHFRFVSYRMILRGDVFPTLSPCEAVGVEQEVTEADVSIVLSDMASYKAPG